MEIFFSENGLLETSAEEECEASLYLMLFLVRKKQNLADGSFKLVTCINILEKFEITTFYMAFLFRLDVVDCGGYHFWRLHPQPKFTLIFSNSFSMQICLRPFS
jgi:hypothetical protein